MPGERSHSTASRSGSGYGSGLSRSAFTTLNIAVFAPMPMASDTTMTSCQAAACFSVRSA